MVHKLTAGSLCWDTVVDPGEQCLQSRFGFSIHSQTWNLASKKLWEDIGANCRGFLHAYARLAKHSLDRGLTWFMVLRTFTITYKSAQRTGSAASQQRGTAP